jgi:amino acid transporter
MGNDGILFKFMKRVHPKTQTPLIATLLSGLFAASMATIFDLHQLIDMMSIGTLLAYTIVAVCVLILHYDPSNTIEELTSTKTIEATTILRQLTNFKFTTQPTNLSSAITKIGVCVYSLLAVILCSLMKFNFTALIATLMVIVIAGMILTIWIIARQPKDTITELSFKVPLVPVLPALSILINLYLMFQLDVNTWIRFGIWVFIGEFTFVMMNHFGTD